MEILSHFKKINTNKDDLYDLDKWQAYEEANPRAFAGMYQFWCQNLIETNIYSWCWNIVRSHLLCNGLAVGSFSNASVAFTDGLIIEL